MLSIDKLFIAKLVSIEAIAVYFTTFTLLRIYELAYQAVEYILLPHSNKLKSIKLKRIISYIIILSTAITVFYLIAGEYLLDVLFDGKYNSGKILIPVFCGIGIFRLLYIIPSSIISGRLKEFCLKQLFFSNSFLVIVNIVLAYIFILKYGLLGAAAATLITWILRSLAAYLILYKNLSNA